MLIDLRKIIRALPIKRGKAFLIRLLVFVLPFYRYDNINVFGQIIKIDLKDNATIGLYLNFGKIILEKEIFTLLEEIVEREDIYWDVGSNIGYYTLFLSTKCNVTAFEPNPKLYSYLKDSVSSYQNVSVLNFALSKIDEETKFYLDEDSSDLSSLIDNGLRRNITVKSRSIDSLILKSGFKPPTIIKIDVEGFEYFVLDGFKSINQFIPLVIFEYVPQFGVKINKTLDDIINLLGPEWSFFRFMANGKISANYQEIKGATNNYLAIHKNFNRLNKIEKIII